MKTPKFHAALKKLKRCLQPLTFAQENFHMGLQYLAVWRFGRLRWEVYDWGANAGSGDLERHLRPLKIGTLECYDRIQNCRAAGICSLVGIYPSWKEARSAKRPAPIPTEAMELSAFLLNEKLAQPGTRLYEVLMRCQQVIMKQQNEIVERIGTETKIEQALETGYWGGPDAPAETLPQAALRIREERDQLRDRLFELKAKISK